MNFGWISMHFWKKKYFFQKWLISLQIIKQNKKTKEIWCGHFLLFSIFYVITASATIRPINLTYLPFLLCFNFKVYHLLFIHYQFNSLSRLFILYLVLRNLLAKLMGKMFSLLFLNFIYICTKIHIFFLIIHKIKRKWNRGSFHILFEKQF